MRMHPEGEAFSRLTCVDMWMDNALSAVPESVICRHRDGVVTRVQRVHTTAIPLLCDAGGPEAGRGPHPAVDVDMTVASVRRWHWWLAP